jgi:hypothetical protein
MNNLYSNNPNGSASLLMLGVIFLGAYALNSYLTRDHDTVNYVLFYKNRVVYHGVCYEDRLEARLDEHERRGLIFDEYDFDHAKPRQKALLVEKRKIRRHGPKYNIHHNF